MPITTPDVVRTSVAEACGFQPRDDASQVRGEVCASSPNKRLRSPGSPLLSAGVTFVDIFAPRQTHRGQRPALPSCYSRNTSRRCAMCSASHQILILRRDCSFALILLHHCAGMLLNQTFRDLRPGQPLKFVAFGHAFRCEAGNPLAPTVAGTFQYLVLYLTALTLSTLLHLRWCWPCYKRPLSRPPV